jgi:hypothetical protein
MTAYNIPTTRIKSNIFGLRFSTRRFVSPFNQFTQTIELLGAKWVATYTTTPLTRAESAAVKAFLMKLRGGGNTFNAYDPDGKTPRGVMSGTPLVKGAGQTGASLVIDGATINITGWGKTGDYFSVNSELKCLTADCNSNGSGEVTLVFEPPLRNSPADNAAITTTNCTCQMILVDDDQAQWNSDENKLSQITFSGVEKLV